MTVASRDKRIPLIGKTLRELKEICSTEGLPLFNAAQICRRLYVSRAQSIDEMTELSKQTREKLGRKYMVGRYKPVSTLTSSDGTKKCLFSVPPTDDSKGGAVEAVYIPDKDRATLCVSSQIGCKMNCSFCATGKLGFSGNLSSGDIINQVLSVPGAERLTNIVFMGMGEPCDNLVEVEKAIEILTSPWGLAWSPKRITVSSVGKLGDMKKLAQDTKVHLALSVHSPFAGERERLMPVEKAWPVKEVIAMLRGFDFAHQRRLSVEYIMWRGLNDDKAHADALAALIKGTSARVNLIRYHAGENDPLQPPSTDVMEAFRDRLNELGVTATIRASRGEDILAACGMLAAKNSPEKDI